MKHALAVMVLGLMALIAVGCGGQEGTPTPGATTVSVELGEWFVRPSVGNVPAGEVTFEAENIGSIPHELVIIQTDLAPEALVLEGA